MSVLVLPTDPAPANMGIAMITAKNVLAPAFGDGEQELLRKGSRYALTFQMPPMRYVTSMDWDDLMAEGDTVVMKVHQPGFDTGAPGTPRVNGAGQSGSALVIDGLTSGYVIRKGQFLSVITQGRRFLYRAKANVTVSSGTATVPLRTMLRFPPADNDVVEIAQPMIEGFVRDMDSWEVGVDRLVVLKFTVRER
ncbi:hypothetical protein [Brevundimonas sp. SPF441]|uniref:hypothetical protein n=1 Tax=Brevundimonas sp. SPF441 TaxID=2663795 RepID=UPI00129EDC20|nr:hypothetical protein [Brevundimonas sp. SPF441]MRL69908.1 hypothetical protein [Brevundimonas sp. SPF441]